MACRNAYTAPAVISKVEIEVVSQRKYSQR